MNSSDPTITHTIYDVNVMTENIDVIEDDNLTPTVVKGDKISVKVTGPRSEVTNLKATDIYAYIDLKELSLTNSCPIHVKFKNSVATKNSEITHKSEEVVIISIEAMTTEPKQVKCELRGKPQESYYAVATVNPPLIEVFGSVNVVSQIDHLVAVVDVSDVNKSFTAKAKVIPYDAEGNLIEDSSLEITNNTVDVQVDIYRTKNVNIVIDAKVSADTGFVCDDVTHAPKSITIAGPDSVLSSLTELSLKLEAENLKETKSENILLADYIPNDCYLVSEIEYVSVTVPVVRLSENKKFETKLRNVRGKNLSKDLKIANDNADVALSIWGVEGAVQSILVTDLGLYVDCSDITKAGVYELELRYDTQKKVMVDKTTITVEIEALENN